MSRLTVHERNAEGQAKRWTILFLAILFIVGSLIHSGLPIAGSAQANEPFSISGQNSDISFTQVHMPGRHAPGGKLPMQGHFQFANCVGAGGCGHCGPVQTVEAVRPETLLMPAGSARPARMSPHITTPPLRPPILQA